MPTVSITWHTQHDDRVCPVCRAIDNYTWTFEGEVPNSLVHPAHGEVWNTVLGSLAHEAPGIRTFSQCRCHITPQFDLKDILEKTKKLHAAVTAEYKEAEV